jgi:phosphocarrier protein HPr
MPASSEPRQVAEHQQATDAVERIVVLPKHLHARPAGQIAQAAARHPATTIELNAGGRRANARSVLAVMALGAVTGTEVRVITTGAGAVAVADEVVDILRSSESDG